MLRASVDRPPLVFISYSHADRKWLDKLRPFLEHLELLGTIEAWADTDLPVGSNWYEVLSQRMDQARAAVLLVTQNFLASAFCAREEVPILLQAHRRGQLTLFPVLLDDCNYKAERWLNRIQMKTWKGAAIRDAGKDYTKVFTELEQELAVAVQDGYQPPSINVAERWSSAGFDLTRLPETGSLLFGRERELRLLVAAWGKQETHIVTLVAGGGVGKSTLARIFCEMLAEENWRGAERAFAWSFYSQGTGRVSSSEEFMASAFAFFGQPIPRDLSLWDQGSRLAEIVRQRKTLLVLDGLEPLQSDSEIDRGSIRDPAVRVLLESLADANNGLCVVTTREPLSDLYEYDKPIVLHSNLEQVDTLAGRALLRVQGVRGEDRELEARVLDLGGHALAVNLLARAIADTPTRHIGTIDIPPLTVPVEQGGHPRRVMDAWAARLGDGAELELLHVLGLFDRPASRAAVQAALTGDKLPGTNRFLKTPADAPVIERLRKAGLVARASDIEPDVLDTHPLVRDHFGARLRTMHPKSFTEAHRRLSDFYAASAEPLPDTLEGMEPLFAALTHACAAGMHQHGWDDIYAQRIIRGRRFFLSKVLGAPTADLACLALFVKERWREAVPTLSPPARSSVLGQCGIRLRDVGRQTAAIEPMQLALEYSIGIDGWETAAIRANNLSELYVHLGDLDQAVVFGRQAVEYADSSEIPFLCMSTRTTHADALMRLGDLAGARTLFAEAERMQTAENPKVIFLTSLQGRQYCELLCAAGQHQHVLLRAKTTLEWAKRSGLLLDVAVNLLSIGYAELRLDPQSPQTVVSIREAIDGLRRAGSQQLLVDGLLIRAELWRLRLNFAAAYRDLREAERIIRRSELRLFEANLAFERAQLLYAEGHIPNARTELARALERVDAMKYGFLRPRVEALAAALA
jgi:tetratricopeptide (TPR) repeat protein